MVAFTRFFTGLFLLPVIKTLAFPTSGNDTTITTTAISLAERSEDLEPVSYDDVPSTEELVLPTFRCMGTWNFMYNHYLVWGKDWHKTEGEIKRAVKSTPRCLVTIYKYRGSRTAEPEQPDEDGLKWDFKLSVSTYASLNEVVLTKVADDLILYHSSTCRLGARIV